MIRKWMFEKRDVKAVTVEKPRLWRNHGSKIVVRTIGRPVCATEAPSIQCNRYLVSYTVQNLFLKPTTQSEGTSIS